MSLGRREHRCLHASIRTWKRERERHLQQIFAALSLIPLLASSAELKVLAAGAITPIVRTVAADFERCSGIHVTVDNATGGVVDKRVRSGAAIDVVVAPDDVLHALGKNGYLNLASERPIAHVGIAVAVKQGAPLPAIATVAHFRKTLLDAPSVAMVDPKAGGSSGIYPEKMFQRPDIATQMKAKEVLVPGGLVAEELVAKSCRSRGQAGVAVAGGYPELHRVCRCRRARTQRLSQWGVRFRRRLRSRSGDPQHDKGTWLVTRRSLTAIFYCQAAT
jgi:ABC-type molybdate transport system substrate-binding protein